MNEEIIQLRAALQKIVDMNEGDRICANSWGQEFFKRCHDIASQALGNEN